MSNGRLVYSTNPVLNQRCRRCKELVSECKCAAAVEMPQKIAVVLRIETAKRGGKKVTAIRGLPAIEQYLRTLAKELKQSCGSGGTYAIEDGSGHIEIQGDRREILRALLTSKGIGVKG